MKAPCLIATVVLLISGCGQKGPLYFAPEEAREQQPTPSTATTPQQEQEQEQEHKD